MPHFDIAQLKSLAAGRWPDILSALGSIDRRILDGKHHPCPKCGGNNRFRVLDATAGGLFCNQCFSSKNGDGIAAVQWLTGCSFLQAVERIADFVGMKPSASKGKKKKPESATANPEAHLEFCDWNESLAGLFCLKKQPIKPHALKLVGARMATYRKQHKVLAIPVMNQGKTVGWCLYSIADGLLPKWSADGKVEQVKVKLTAGSKAGIIGHWPDGFTRAIKTEGPSDLLALLSLEDFPADVSAFCNANGAVERPDKFEELKTRLAGIPVDVVHDCDKPGQQGATYVEHGAEKRAGWCPWLAGFAGRVRNVVLPYPITENHGKDLRDWLTEGNSFAAFDALAEGTAEFVASPNAPPEIDEFIDDPFRLARINLAEYEIAHQGKLVYWRDEFHKYKRGRYRTIGRSELKAKITASIRREFERAWLERDKSSDDEDRPVRKVTRNLVNDVLGATESMISLSSEINQPCWLSDRKRRNYLSMKNCMVDLDALFAGKDESEVCLPHSPQWFSSTQLDYPFDPGAESKKWQTYIERFCNGDEEMYSLLQEWAGYLLLPSTDEQSFLMLEGEGGTGKTSFLTAMEAMLGTSNCSHLSLEDIGETFGLSSTIGKMANIAGDVGDGRLDGNEEAILKRYTGGDTMRIRRMYVPSIDARPTAKLMMACNGRPKFRDKSGGLWRRMILIPVNRIIPREERTKGMTEVGYWAGEVSGIFNWALSGLARLLEQGGFSDCKAKNEAVDDYRHDVNPSLEFLELYLEPCEHGSIRSIDIYQTYLHWCKSRNLNPLGERQFGKEMRRLHPGVERKQKRDGRERYWSIEKIRFTVDEIEGKKVLNGNLFS